MSDIEAGISRAVEQVKARIEAILPEASEYNAQFLVPNVIYTLSHISTDLKKVMDIDYRNLMGMCGSLSYQVRDTLYYKHGIIMDTFISDDPNSLGHVYHVTNEDGIEVLVDMSAGQFLIGHNHIYVGTRNQLKNIVLNNTYLDQIETPLEGKYGLVTGFDIPKERESAFRGIWGESSRKFPVPIAEWPDHLKREDR